MKKKQNEDFKAEEGTNKHGSELGHFLDSSTIESCVRHSLPDTPHRHMWISGTQGRLPDAEPPAV